MAETKRATQLTEGAAARKAAAAGTRAAGRAVVAAAKEVSPPLIVGGAALAGVVGGLAVRARETRSRSTRLGGMLPFRDGQLDLDAIAAGAENASSVGRQVGQLARSLKQVQTQ